MRQKIYIRKIARRKVEREFRHFKRRMMYGTPKEGIWEACGRIHFYNCLYEYFDLNGKIPMVYLELVLAVPDFLDMAWRVYLKQEDSGYQTWSEISDLMEKILMRWKLPIAG